MVGTAEAGTGWDAMAGAASGVGYAVVGGRKRGSTGSAEEAARGGSKARVDPGESAARKRRRAGYVTGDEAPVVGPGVCEPVGGARLDWAGASEARASGGKGEARGVVTSLEARARRVATRRQTSGQGQGRPKTAGKEGAWAPCRGGCEPGGPVEHGSRGLVTLVVVGASLARAGAYPQTDQVPQATLPTQFDGYVGRGPWVLAFANAYVMAFQTKKTNLTRGSGPGLAFALMPPLPS